MKKDLPMPSAQPPNERTWLQLCDPTNSMMPITNPKLRMLLGALMMAGAAGFFGVKGVVFQWGIMFAVMGFALLLSGNAQVSRNKSVQVELQKASFEWADLRNAARSCTTGRGSFAQELSVRGYRDYFVRRWIVARLLPESKVDAKQVSTSDERVAES